MLAGLAAVAIRGVTDARIAEAQTDAAELVRLRGLYDELLSAVGNKLEKSETHSLWVEGVRAVCGHDALHEVYDWMAAEKKRRTQIAHDAQAPQFSAPLPASLVQR